jgi:hypothetical protein
MGDDDNASEKGWEQLRQDWPIGANANPEQRGN